jgi:putative glycerol-1-phosphate prenyltransferase
MADSPVSGTLPELPWPDPPNWRAWRHVTKLDPDCTLDDATLDLVLRSGTDAILLGGSTGITAEAVSSLLGRLIDSPIPVALEVSSLAAAMPGPALFLVPLVLNTRNSEWMGGAQVAAMSHVLDQYGPIIPWKLLLPEAYLVLNPDSTVARLTAAETDLDTQRAAAYAAFAGRVLRLPLLYVEYSGTFGDMTMLAAVKAQAGQAHVIYGGGIQTAAHAAQASAIADTVVIGNLVYTDPQRLYETVLAVK